MYIVELPVCLRRAFSNSIKEIFNKALHVHSGFLKFCIYIVENFMYFYKKLCMCIVEFVVLAPPFYASAVLGMVPQGLPLVGLLSQARVSPALSAIHKSQPQI